MHTAEGYIKHTINPFATNPTIGAYHDFDYVYNYTDHLGNIRLSYTLDPATQEIKVMEENHYYPFGLKHTYNLDRRDIGYFDHLLAGTLDPSQDTRRTRMVNNNGYQYKYQEQERQEELGLNWDSFKWRNYDYAIGRFMSIDPLAEKYNYQSPYNFAENRVVDGNELEGLEWVNAKDKQIYDPNANDGKGGYTKYATKKDKKIGNNLQKTEAGRTQFNKLVNSSIPTTIKVKNGKGPSKNTENYLTGLTIYERDDNEKVVKSDITIYKGRIKDYMRIINAYFDAGKGSELPQDAQLYYTNTENMDERVTSNVGHEIEHAVSEENQATSCPDCEIIPEAIEIEILEQTPSSRE